MWTQAVADPVGLHFISAAQNIMIAFVQDNLHLARSI